MSAITVRTRGNRARLTVLCTDSTPHTITIDRDGTITNEHHSPDEAAVILALGGTPSPCGQAEQIYHAAHIVYLARTGEHDDPTATFSSRRSWRTRTDCPTCGYHPSAAHIHTIGHQLGSQGLSEFVRAGSTLVTWLHRTGRPSTALTSTRDLVTAGLVTAPDSNGIRLTPQTLTTLPFIRAAYSVIGEDLNSALRMRRGGLTVHWLTDLGRHLNPRTRNRIAAETAAAGSRSGPTERAIIKARNINARTIAQFLNAGIHSHLHTYARAHARPDQVLTVYDATQGRTTLADLLEQGHTVTEAVRRAAT
jgi:hypothetical protein